MTEATNTKMMDIEAGGEQTQYEGSHTFSDPHAKDGGQMGGDATTTEASEQARADKTARGEKTAENVRYGEAISEHGFGGETTGNSGAANEGGFGRVKDKETSEGDAGSRAQMGYEGGSGVGA